MNNRLKLLIALGTAASNSQAVFAQAKKPSVLIRRLSGARARDDLDPRSVLY